MSFNEAGDLYNLLLIGHMWLRDAKSHKPMHTNSSILTGWHNARVLTNQQFRQARGTALLNPITLGSEFVYGRAKRPPGELTMLARKSDKQLLVLLPGQPGTLIHRLLVQSGGYFTVITEAGMAHARSLPDRYPSLDRDAFLKGWRDAFNSWR